MLLTWVDRSLFTGLGEENQCLRAWIIGRGTLVSKQTSNANGTQKSPQLLFWYKKRYFLRALEKAVHEVVRSALHMIPRMRKSQRWLFRNPGECLKILSICNSIVLSISRPKNPPKPKKNQQKTKPRIFWSGNGPYPQSFINSLKIQISKHLLYSGFCA